MGAKVIFVGEAPSSRPGPPLGGAIGRRLAELAGVPEAELRERCEMVNLLPVCPPLQGSGCCRGKGRTFPARKAEVTAAVLEARSPDAAFVLLGRRVARAFGLVNLPPVADLGRFLSVPHPSGPSDVVLFWNRVENRQTAGIVLRRFLRRHGVIPGTKRPRRSGV